MKKEGPRITGMSRVRRSSCLPEGNERKKTTGINEQAVRRANARLRTSPSVYGDLGRYGREHASRVGSASGST